MAKLTRITGKVFGSNATATIGGIGQFGSAITGTPNLTTDVATIQALPAYLNGWGSAVVTSRNFPPIEEVTGVLKTISYQACYTLQEGIPEYDINTEYSNTSLVKSVNNGIVTIYASLQNNNIGNSLSDGAYWKPYILDRIQRNIGEIVQSTIPLTDAGLHLLDGSLLSGSGSYGAFVSYIAGLYTADPTANYFTTEADWQTSVSTYGVCGKFVYDSVNNTVRLPKVTGFVEGASGVATLGNLTQAGLPNITGTIGLQNQSFGSPSFTGSFASDSWSRTNASGDGGTDSGLRTVSFNASRSSSIYGNSSTVQPQSIKVLYYIVVATATKTQIQVDIDEIATDLNGKADVDLSNISASASAKSTIMTWGNPDYSSGISVTWDSDYTCPSNGWVYASGNSQGSSASSYVYLIINGISFRVSNGTTGYVDIASLFVPVTAGDIVKGTGGANTQEIRFYPSKGAS